MMVITIKNKITAAPITSTVEKAMVISITAFQTDLYLNPNRMVRLVRSLLESLHVLERLRQCLLSALHYHRFVLRLGAPR
jgi:hypothetical protein